MNRLKKIVFVFLISIIAVFLCQIPVARKCMAQDYAQQLKQLEKKLKTTADTGGHLSNQIGAFVRNNMNNMDGALVFFSRYMDEDMGRAVGRMEDQLTHIKDIYKRLEADYDRWETSSKDLRDHLNTMAKDLLQ